MSDYSAINDVVNATFAKQRAYTKMQGLLSQYSETQAGNSTGLSPKELRVEMFKTSIQAQSATQQQTLAESFVKEELADQKKTIDMFA